MDSSHLISFVALLRTHSAQLPLHSWVTPSRPHTPRHIQLNSPSFYFLPSSPEDVMKWLMAASPINTQRSRKGPQNLNSTNCPPLSKYTKTTLRGPTLVKQHKTGCLLSPEHSFQSKRGTNMLTQHTQCTRQRLSSRKAN